MLPEYIIYLASAFLSALFEYLPGLAQKYNALADNVQKLIMLFMLVLVVGVTYAASCVGFDSSYACTQEGLIAAAQDLLIAIAINQGIHKILPKQG